jgi:hypothetical protein
VNKPRSIVTVILGAFLALSGTAGFVMGGGGAGPFVPVLIGISLVYLGFRGGRRGRIVFGHACIVAGCYLVAWGVHLAQIIGSAPTWLQILTQPLFWGLFSILGGICANFHGFCHCVQGLEAERRKPTCCQAGGDGPS